MAAENVILENISNKLNFYIIKNNISLVEIAKIMNIPYQPLYRTYKKLNAPSIDLILDISKFLDCTYEELISEDIFIDIPAVNHITEIQNFSDKIYRVYLNYDKKDLFLKDSIIGLVEGIEYKDIVVIHLYKKINYFELIGKYILKYKNECKEYSILGIRKTTLYYEEDGKEMQLNINEVEAIAFNCGKVICFEYPNIMQGVRIK